MRKRARLSALDRTPLQASDIPRHDSFIKRTNRDGLLLQPSAKCVYRAEIHLDGAFGIALLLKSISERGKKGTQGASLKLCHQICRCKDLLNSHKLLLWDRNEFDPRSFPLLCGVKQVRRRREPL